LPRPRSTDRFGLTLHLGAPAGIAVDQRSIQPELSREAAARRQPRCPWQNSDAEPASFCYSGALRSLL